MDSSDKALGSLKIDPNWFHDLEGHSVPIEFAAVLRYGERAFFAYNAAVNDKCSPVSRAAFTGFCAQACCSIVEAFHNYDLRECKEELRESINTLPFRELIEDVRNHDIHGRPVPCCEPNRMIQEVSSRQGSPMKITSKGKGGISIQFHGPKPVVTKSGDPKNSKFNPGQTISFQCVDGALCVWDYRTETTYKVLGVLRVFLEAAGLLIERVAAEKGVVIKAGSDN